MGYTLAKIAVTGGSGRLGRFVIAELREHGYVPINVDRLPPSTTTQTPDTTPFIQANMADKRQVQEALAGSDAVIHLAAIPAPKGFPAEEVFVNNTRATFHVLDAAVEAGMNRAVIASSVSAYGMAWAPNPFAPHYAPLDEDHPLLVQDPYGLSKEVDERTGQMLHRQSGIQVAALRFHWVALPQDLSNMPPKGIDPATGGLANNLWGYVDARDAATACRLAIERDGFGFDTFNITAGDTLCAAPTASLLERFFPETDRRQEIEGTSTGFSLEKATRILGWRPRYSWRAG